MSVSTPIVPQLQIPPYISPFVEDENTVRARLLAAIPDGVSQEVGTWARDFTEITVAEFVRQWASLGQMLAQVYVEWATGQQLDAWAASYGLTRSLGSAAYGQVRFFAPAGTPIPPAVVVEVPQTDPNATRLRYSTTNTVSLLTTAVGYIDVPVQALDVGIIYNVAPGAITLVDSSLPAVTSIANLWPTVAGEDPETDADLVQRVLLQAELPVGSGTVIDYIVWGDEVPGVGDTSVYPQWDSAGVNPGVFDGRQNGSVLLVLRDEFNAPVEFVVVQAAQQHIAPSRQIIATCEEPAWTRLSASTNSAFTFDTTRFQMGFESLKIQSSAASSNTILQLARPLDLSRFAPTDLIIIWVYASTWANVSDVVLQLYQDSANYFNGDYSHHAADGVSTGPPTLGWWQWRIQFNQLTTAGAPNLAGIQYLQLLATTTVSGTIVNFDYWYACYINGATGLGGRAPVGADVTCITPVPFPITVTLTHVLLQDGYTLVDTPGSANALTVLAVNLAAYFQALAPGADVRFVDVAQVVHDSAGFIDFALSLPQAAGTPPVVPVAPTQDATLGPLTASS